MRKYITFRPDIAYFAFQILIALLFFVSSCRTQPGDGLQANQRGGRKQEYFLDILSGKDIQPPADDPVLGGGESGSGDSVDPAKIADLNRLVGKNEIYRSLNPNHMEALQKCIDLLREKDNWLNIMVRASKIREQINVQLWINAVISTTVYSPAMAGLHKPALIELSPDRFLPRSVIQAAINQSESNQRQAASCTVLDETTGTVNGIENNLWYFREDIQLNAQHWYWHVAYPTAISTPRPDRRGELFYFFHESMLARYNSERLSNKQPLTSPLKADTSNEIIQEGYITYLTDVNSGSNWGSRPPNQRISYSPNLPFLQNLYSAIDSKTLIRTNGQSVDMRNTQAIDILGDVVERSAYSINSRQYGNIHNNGHNLIAQLGNDTGVMADTTTSMRDIVFYRWHTFINDILERHKALLTEYSPTGGDYPLVWPGVQVTSIQINSGSATPANNLRTFWSQRSFDISRGLDLRRVSSSGAVPVCIKHLNHNPFRYTINVAKQNPGQQRASIRIFLAPRFNNGGVRFSMEEQRKLIFVLDAFSVNLNPGVNVIIRNSSASSLTKPWSKTFAELENETGDTVTTPQCGCGWPEHLLIPKGDEDGMVFDLFVMVTNGAEDSSGDLGEQSGTCSQPYHYCGIRGQNYPDKKPMGFPFDRRAPFLAPGRRVANLEEFVGIIPNSRTVQVTITHTNRVL